VDIIEINGVKFKKLFSKEQIHEAIKVIATEIEKDYADSSPLFLVVMKGAIFFAADLIRLVNLQSQIEVISAKSYGAQMESSGNVELKSFGENFKGKDIIILEDIVDSGLTLKSLTDYVHTFNPKSVAVAALLSKTTARKVDVEVNYIGIEVPELFVVGNGLDYSEYGRQLLDIYIKDED
jgi:hypoxanthine phosphoribosyltransferase